MLLFWRVSLRRARGRFSGTEANRLRDRSKASRDLMKYTKQSWSYLQENLQISLMMLLINKHYCRSMFPVKSHMTSCFWEITTFLLVLVQWGLTIQQKPVVIEVCKVLHGSWLNLLIDGHFHVDSKTFHCNPRVLSFLDSCIALLESMGSEAVWWNSREHQAIKQWGLRVAMAVWGRI